MIELNNILSSQISSLNRTAENIKNNGIKNIEKNIVNLIQEEISFKANSKTIETNNEILGTIINLKV